VRVILEATMDNTDTISTLKAAGIEVHNSAASFYLHAKLIVSDGVAFIGSENFSPTSLTRNREVGELLFEQDQLTPIHDQFDSDWSSSPGA
jgi:phosphatidylserine/phosphatidylglycerophosphate/cardiolipin synthase-like enzyme